MRLLCMSTTIPVLPAGRCHGSREKKDPRGGRRIERVAGPNLGRSEVESLLPALVALLDSQTEETEGWIRIHARLTRHHQVQTLDDQPIGLN